MQHESITVAVSVLQLLVIVAAAVGAIATVRAFVESFKTEMAELTTSVRALQASVTELATKVAVLEALLPVNHASTKV